MPDAGEGETERGQRGEVEKEETGAGIEERDARTIFCLQLSQRCRARDVEDFFSSVGKVRDVKNLSPWVYWPPPYTVLLLSAGR